MYFSGIDNVGFFSNEVLIDSITQQQCDGGLDETEEECVRALCVMSCVDKERAWE